MSEISNRISALRTLMADRNIEAYIVTSHDPHISEYVSEYWKLRSFISGFTGSAGSVIIGKNKAGLWTDSRYFVQAPKELAGTGIDLMKQGDSDTPSMSEWISEHVAEGKKVGCFGETTTISQLLGFKEELATCQIELVTTDNLIAELRSGISSTPKDDLLIHDIALTGESASDKIARMRAELKEEGSEAMLITALDEIAWLTNLRGSDIPFNPVFYCYIYLEQDNGYLFIDDQRLSQQTIEYIHSLGLTIKPYSNINVFLAGCRGEVLADFHGLNASLYAAGKNITWIDDRTPIRLAKSIKNNTEANHIKNAMIRDGVALVKLFRWVETQHGHGGVSEYVVGQKIAEFRSKQDKYKGESFSPIVGWKGNGAIVHYSAKEADAAIIQGDGVLLVDSGGQYLDGTTDITRTISFGAVDAEIKRDYTCVLKGHIALAKLRFPDGTMGVQMDILARQFLWQEGLNYGHGTGHGVGFFLNVHEPPQGVVPFIIERGETPHRAGMFTSNEPGFYKINSHGIRIENLILAVPDKQTDFGQFLHFETLTLFPISTDLIDHEMMGEGDKAWLNAYHKKVYAKLAPNLNEQEQQWLKLKCKAI